MTEEVYDRAVSGKALWLKFYDLERSLFAMFESLTFEGLDSGGDITGEFNSEGLMLIDQIEGYLPHYKETKNKDGTVSTSTPKNVRQIVMMNPPAFTKIDGLMKDMEKAYIKAVEARGDEYKKMPQRFPRIIENVASIKVHIYPAFASVSIKPEKDLVLYKRRSNHMIKKNDEQAQEYWDSQIKYFRQKGIDAWLGVKQGDEDGTEMATHIVVSSKDLLNACQTDKLQFRTETGHKYMVSVYDSYDDVRQMTYGWLLIKHQMKKDIDVTSINTRELRSRLERRATLMNLPFLPKTMKFWEKI